MDAVVVGERERLVPSSAARAASSSGCDAPSRNDTQSGNEARRNCPSLGWNAVEPIVVTDAPKPTVTVRLASDELVVTETRYAAGERGPDLHVHHLHADCFYVLEGLLTLALDDGERKLGPEAFALVPPDVVHTFRSDGPGELRFFNFHAPGMGFDRYCRGFTTKSLPPFDQHPPPEGGGRDPSLVIAGTGEFVTYRPSLRVTLLADASELGVTSWWSAPGGSSPAPHLHRRHAESFCGSRRCRSRSTTASCTPRPELGTRPPKAVHTFAFSGSDDVRFLNVHTPSCGFGDFLPPCTMPTTRTSSMPPARRSMKSPRPRLPPCRRPGKLVADVTARHPVRESRCSGCGLKRENGKVVAGSWKDGGLTVKLTDEAAREQALQIPGTELFDPGMGRVMREWVLVPPAQSGEWKRLVEQAIG